MTHNLRTRSDPRREATRKALVEAAETLFAEQGIRAVTVRQIAAAVKSSNNNVVSYHFGNKEALIDAIFYNRLPELDKHQAEILAYGLPSGDARVRLRALAEALWRPTFEAVNAAGRRSYARFLRTVMVEDQGHRLRRIASVFPQTKLILDEVEALVPVTSANEFRWRFATATYMVLDAICLAEEEVLELDERSEDLFCRTLDMAVAIMLT